VLDASYVSASESSGYYSPFPKSKTDDEIMIVDEYKYELEPSIASCANDEEVKEAAIPVQMVEQKPLFQGESLDSFSKWVNSRLVYPKLAEENGVQGRVVLKFTIDKDGSLIDVVVIRSAHPDLDNEALRVVLQSPKWEPGKHNGRVVPVEYIIPVIFQFK
jgi:protein TonB